MFRRECVIGLKEDFREIRSGGIEGRHQGKPEVVGLRGEQGLQIEYDYSVCPKRFVDTYPQKTTVFR